MNWKNLVSSRFTYYSQMNGSSTGLFSMIGMGVGCFAMIVSLSIMNGFEFLVHKKLKSFDGDMRITGSIDISKIDRIDGINSIMPFMERRGIIQDDDEQRVVSLKAVDIQTMISFYRLPIKGEAPKIGQVVIGQDIAYRLRKDIGDKIMISSPIDQSFGFGLPMMKEMIISGIFSTRVLDHDDRFVFLSLEDGKKIFQRKSQLDGYDIRLSSDRNNDLIKSEIRAELGDDIYIDTWDDLNRDLVDAMRMERFGTIIILSLIFLVSAFNLAASLSLISIQKMKEVGILKTMGASQKSIKIIMMNLGIKQAGKGAIGGYLLGILLVIMQNLFGFIPLPSDIYFIDSLPMTLFMMDLIIVMGISFIFIMLASLISGHKLAQTQIKDSLQWAK
tara:strand:- start:741 stop:1907 length:1167 start_codon:yes stop_codon:yes gene_type:complete